VRIQRAHGYACSINVVEDRSGCNAEFYLDERRVVYDIPNNLVKKALKSSFSSAAAEALAKAKLTLARDK